MARYFIELSYKGTNYGGFQKQENANTVQAEVERALSIYFRRSFQLTGSSRTDAGVHALKNFFHFDDLEFNQAGCEHAPYHLNAILPEDIVIRSIFKVSDDSHCRFDALSRTYEYRIYDMKDPFLSDRAYFYPYRLDVESMQTAAGIIAESVYFEAFCKKHAQVSSFNCTIFESGWRQEAHQKIYRVRGNRFLRGMVRGLTGTMLKVGTGKLKLETFKQIIQSGDMRQVDFSVPPQGLTLMDVEFGLF